MKINRAWAMPNKNTFKIKPINELIQKIFNKYGKDAVACDPFVNNSPFKSLCKFTNDLDPSVEAGSHMDALEFLQGIEDDSIDIFLFDPPYSPRQVSESYKKFGMSVNTETTQASYWTKLKIEAERIVKDNGAAICCGWNSGGIGDTYGFSTEEILLVPHGGWHNDTIITVCRKIA